MPTMGSTEDQITTQTKFPTNSTSADSVSGTIIITCHIGRIYFCKADNSDNTNKANTVIGISGRFGRDFELDPLTNQPSEKSKSKHISDVSKSAGATAEVRAEEVSSRASRTLGQLTKQTINRSNTVLIDPEIIRLFIGLMQ